MPMASSSSTDDGEPYQHEVYDPTYREKDVDDTLNDHEERLTRLEKIALIGIGYGLAEGATLVTQFPSIL